MRSHCCRVLIVTVALGLDSLADAQGDLSKVEIRTEKLAEGLCMMTG
jgi:hypothetical protein